ncbi:MAG: DNA polymerase III subunit gamma and tau [Corynebacterium sp.]|uniref:DNA polymerase III subunit gamma and tau n=1 Tax=Corynebacterium sp. TaxID=1720 RepID=UPI0026DDA34D|nr:DNA polymerase III subunit gamma and tau [Corynebacterium sp.]MDO5099212.1 DNA polymerase III subunit gamma and tau [Corynebacterium sp.]
MALYRKYRPGSFGELVGQEQVTVPLSAALNNGRINHAYLFSGPRGCGKTSSARIMARSLNCVEGPTATPCGVCNSCISLAPNGPGNLDVTELDAASHNGVEDMRELRDRAMFAPAESRYRIFIIDEAHMITNQGSNALLKIVEEPPAHLIFIFATTEPERVIGTIRSRTHHYPFRLLTPSAMRGLLERTVASENVQVEDSVYPLVIRAGGGSPRDTLSVLDQLIAGTGPEGLTYEHARLLLGVTDDSLIDAAVTALAHDDKAGLFLVVDDVIEAGLSPRKFSEDLLDRLRDLIMLQAVPDALAAGLVDAPTDRGEVLSRQAQAFAPNHLPRIAATLNDGIAGLRGATSPRLLLEILCAKMLLGGAQQPQVISAPAAAGTPAATAPAAPAAAPADSPATATPPKYERPSVRRAREEAEAKAKAEAEAREAEAKAQAQSETAPEPTVAPAAEPEPQPAEEPKEVATEPNTPEPVVAEEPPQPAPTEPVEQPAMDPIADITKAWSKIIAEVKRTNEVAGILLTGAKPLGVKEDTLIIGHNTGALAARLNSTDHNGFIADAVKELTQHPFAVECVIGTDPKRHGFDIPQPQPVWNPHAHTDAQPADAEPADEPQEPERETNNETIEEALPATEPADTWGEPAPIGEEKKTPPRTEAPAPPAGETPAPEPETAPTPADTWGEPAHIGAEDDTSVSQVETAISDMAPANKPAPQPVVAAASEPAAAENVDKQPAEEHPAKYEPTGFVPPVLPTGYQQSAQQPAATPQPQPTANAQPKRSRWQEAAERGAAKLAAQANAPRFADGTPAPPEPVGWDDAPPPDDPYGYPPDEGMPAPTATVTTTAATEPAAAEASTSESEEAEMMQQAASEVGTKDHRSAMTVAMDLLEQELGARAL